MSTDPKSAQAAGKKDDKARTDALEAVADAARRVTPSGELTAALAALDATDTPPDSTD
jgi:hypothetical protein